MSSDNRAERRRQERAAAKRPRVANLPTERDGMRLVYMRGGGDCLRACIASIVGCDLDDTPAEANGNDDDPGGVQEVWAGWLAERGMALAESSLVAPVHLPRWIAMVPTGPHAELHAIVVSGENVMHDPASAIDPAGDPWAPPFPIDPAWFRGSLIVGPAQWVAEHEQEMKDAERQALEQHIKANGDTR